MGPAILQWRRPPGIPGGRRDQMARWEARRSAGAHHWTVPTMALLMMIAPAGTIDPAGMVELAM